MDLTLFLLAMTPILFVVIGVGVLRLPVVYVAIFTLIYTIELVVFDFEIKVAAVKIQIVSAIVEGLKTVFMIWAIFLILNMLLKTGAMDKIKDDIANLTNDKRKQVIMIAFCFGCLLEGIAGVGIPLVIVAPFLVAIGLPAMQAVIVALVSDGIAASLDGIVLTAASGFVAYSDLVEAGEFNVLISSMIFIEAVLAPFIVLYILYGKKAFDKGITIFCLITGIVYGGSAMLISTFVSVKFSTICAGILSLLAAILCIKVINKKQPAAEEFTCKSDENAPKNKMNSVTAMSLFLILFILILVVRFFAPHWFIGLGTAFCVGVAGFATCCLGAVIFHDIKSIPYYMIISFKSIKDVLIAMCTLLAISNLMETAGLFAIIVRTLADMTGMLYPVVAVLIGSLGCFATGTTTGSNMLFFPLHLEACKLYNIKLIPVLAAQNMGSALGNMICTNNILTSCATVGLAESEWMVIRRVFHPICILWIACAFLVLCNVYIF